MRRAKLFLSQQHPPWLFIFFIDWSFFFSYFARESIEGFLFLLHSLLIINSFSQFNVNRFLFESEQNPERSERIYDQQILLPENDDSSPNGEMKNRRLSINSQWTRLDEINGNKHDENSRTGTSLDTRHPSILPLIHSFITSLEKQTTWRGLERWNFSTAMRWSKDFYELSKLKTIDFFWRIENCSVPDEDK